MSFRPSIHGWPFGNVEGPEAHLLGLGTLPEGALGGGLCWAALDRYLRGVGIARGTRRPEPGEPLHAELVRRQVAALSGVWERVGEWQERPEGSWRDRLPIRLFGGRDLASLSRAEWSLIQSRLDAGEPVLLTLLCRTDGYRRPHAVRQVLATAWRLADVRVVLSVYDPARPNDDGVHLSFRPAGPLDARLSGGSEVRGFLATPYDRGVPAPLRVETFADRAVIGLNRPVKGRPAAARGRRRIDLVARNAEGALIHFHRARGGNWEGANVTEREKLGSHEVHTDPAVVRSLGLHVFALSYVGDLLHFRLGRSWRVANRTDHKRAGAAFRLVGTPVAVAGRRGWIDVLGTDKEGGLVHYRGHPVLGWSAARVPGEPLAGGPVVDRRDGTLHVAGVTRDGRLVHREWDGAEWTASDPGSGWGDEQPPRLAGRVVLGVTDGGVHIAARSADQRLMVVSRIGDGAWEATELAHDLAGDPVVSAGPAGLHLFAPADDGDVLHAWRDSDWCVESLLASRSSLSPLPPTPTLTAWGSDQELRIWGRSGRDLWMLLWRADSDWIQERLSDRAGVSDRHRPGDDPIVLEDQARQPHLFATDGRGTVLHLEGAAWREPGVRAESDEMPAAATSEEQDQESDQPLEAAASTEQEPEQEPEPEPELEPNEPLEVAALSEPEPQVELEPKPQVEPELEPEPEPEPEPEEAIDFAALLEPETEPAEPEVEPLEEAVAGSVEPWAASEPERTAEPAVARDADLPELDPWAAADADGGVEAPEEDLPELDPWAAPEADAGVDAPEEAPVEDPPEPDPWAAPEADADGEAPEDPSIEDPPELDPWAAPEEESDAFDPRDPWARADSAEEPMAASEEPAEEDRDEPTFEPFDLSLMDDWPPTRKREKRGKEKS